jgi:hypothetical protein
MLLLQGRLCIGLNYCRHSINAQFPLDILPSNKKRHACSTEPGVWYREKAISREMDVGTSAKTPVVIMNSTPSLKCKTDDEWMCKWWIVEKFLPFLRQLLPNVLAIGFLFAFICGGILGTP